jgi:hypothetical protein
MMESKQLYNSSNLLVFIEYISSSYPGINIDKVLQYSAISDLEISDAGQWFTQEQIDRFYEILEKETGNQALAREAGRFVVQSKSSTMLRQYTAAFVTPAIAFWTVGKIASTVSRHISFKVNSIASNKIELIATLKEGVKEKLYQCENRIGLFEGLAKYFTGEHPTIEHNECIHKGNASCKYIISWKMLTSRIWKLVGSYSLLLGTISSAILLILGTLPFKLWIVYFCITLLISTFSFLIAEKLNIRILNKSIESQQSIAEKYTPI